MKGTGPPLTLLWAGGHPRPGSDRSVAEEPPGSRGTRGGEGEQVPPRCSREGHQEQPRGAVRSSLGVLEVRGGVCRAPSEQRTISCLFPGGDTESGLGSVCASVNAE